MAPSRKPANGRSPLVNPQRQITSFFSKATTKQSPKKSNSTATVSQTPSPTPSTPSPIQSKPNKPLLVIGGTPSQSPLTPSGAGRLYGKEVVDKRIRVYWPLDKEWYEGRVKSYNEGLGKHLIQYDDFEEELLDLEKEKFEWIEESVKRFKRLRRGSLNLKQTVIEDEELEIVEEKASSVEADDSDDEDWEKNEEKVADEDGDQETELVDDEEEKRGSTRKRKSMGRGSFGSQKKKGDGEIGNKKLKVSVVEPMKKNEEKGVSNGVESALLGDAPEKFRQREAEKLWFLGAKRRDAKKRCPGDAYYDPRTLYLPPDFVKSLSDGQRQWWEFKSKHMDKVLFFKMGKFYELFEMDAHIGAKELDLQYMKGEQPHCGFPERNFSMNVEKLARKGYRVLVVEQTETPEQLELRRKEKGSKDKVVKREICAVVTKGTLTEGEMLSANPDASYLMALTENIRSLASEDFKRTFGVCVVDVATSRMILGQFGDDDECSSLCCLLTELRPVEIIKPAKLLSPETERALTKHTRNPLVNELVPLTEFWNAEKTVSEVKAIYGHICDQTVSGSLNESNMVPNNCSVAENESICLPDVLSDLVKKGEDGSLALSALGGTLYYLKQAFLDETLLRFAKFESLPCSDFKGVAEKPYMILDSAALENLEIFENSRIGDSSGTLYAQLNHCVTAPGKRLLKTWLTRPLYHSEHIKERQDAVAGLSGINQSTALEFRKTISRLPDMERLLARIFSGSGANGRNANKVVLYEDAAKKQLQEFISALRGCELMAQACSSLSSILENVESSLLNHLLTPGKGLPGVNSVIKHFKDAFDWVEANNSGRVIPHEGADLEYDSACKRVKEIESRLTKHLKEQRKLLGDSSITYVTVGKETYLLEVPEHLRGSVPRDFELRSSKKGFFRYWTPNIKKLVGDLSQAESEKESTLKSILQRLIANFCQYHDKWRQMVSATAELDVLISLAIASDFYEGPTCRPDVRGSSGKSDSGPCFYAKSMGHPIIRSDSLGKGAFVPNDIRIGGSGCANFILLTGPNMGGKSTLIRQVCLAVILSQVGANVPAESLNLSPVDRIFVRMGAKDHIMAGQSTFLTELSETALMLSSATRNSLVALDELGRGTSTSDGQAIAEAVLEHFVQKVHCRGMFSTHYHRLAVDYEKNPKVSLFHMACHVGISAGRVEEVTFLYRLSPGACPKSYGVNVARLAGLPDSVLQKAAAISKEFEAKYGKHSKGTPSNLGDKSCSEEKVRFIQNLMDIIRNSASMCSSNTGISSLVELQYKARTLLE